MTRLQSKSHRYNRVRLALATFALMPALVVHAQTAPPPAADPVSAIIAAAIQLARHNIPRNAEGVPNEKSVECKVVKLFTGASCEAIKKNGLRGGGESVISKPLGSWGKNLPPVPRLPTIPSLLQLSKLQFGRTPELISAVSFPSVEEMRAEREAALRQSLAEILQDKDFAEVFKKRLADALNGKTPE